MFKITTLDMDNLPLNEEKKVDYSKDLFNELTYITGTGQLHGEAFAMAFKKIYTFGPTFRTEKSNTKTHANEFWMIEPEIAFCDLDELMNIEEELLKYVVNYVMERCPDELELFNKFGIDKFAEVKISDLSTGMKQKTSIVVSLVNNPDIIIFDEPTNGLDILTARQVTDYLLELKEQGKTIIISTHIMSLVDKICDRVGIIIDGKMIVCDTIENVKKLSPNNDLEEVFFNLYKEIKGGE